MFDVLCVYVVGVGVERNDCYEPEYAYPVVYCHCFIVPYFVWVFNAKYPLGGGHGFSSKNQPICCFVFKKLLLHTFLLMCAGRSFLFLLCFVGFGLFLRVWLCGL